MIQQRVNARVVRGAKANSNGTEISHLLFANDNLLFTRATGHECTTIVDILNKYKSASGQEINYEKSGVSFNKGVSCEQKANLITLLNMRQADKHHKYLGIPTIDERPKKVIFRELVDRRWKS